MKKDENIQQVNGRTCIKVENELKKSISKAIKLLAIELFFFLHPRKNKKK
jgi:hypothetical protein